MGRRAVLAVLAALLLLTVSGCSGLLGGGSSEDEVLEMLKASARQDGETMPTSIECEESDALDDVDVRSSFDKAKTCNVTYEAGPASEFCVLEGTESGAGWSMLPEACEDAAAGGWGRVTP